MSSRNAPPHKVCGEECSVPVNKVIFSLDHAGKRPLACDWSCIYSCRHRISMKIGGRNTKSRLSLPFSFSRFSPLRLPFLHLTHWLFSLALLFASILSCFLLPWLVPERNYFRKPWDFFSFPKINCQILEDFYAPRF